MTMTMKRSLLAAIAMNSLFLGRITVSSEGLCNDCACNPSDYHRIGICSYCNNTKSELLPLHDRTCGNYPFYANSQIAPPDCIAGDSTYKEMNPCCNQFEAGEDVLVFYYHDMGRFVKPITSLPFECSNDDKTGCDVNAMSKDLHQTCNSAGYCGLPKGTVIASANLASEGSSSTTCFYEIKFDAECYPKFPLIVAYYPQDWIIPVIDELVEPCDSSKRTVELSNLNKNRTSDTAITEEDDESPKTTASEVEDTSSSPISSLIGTGGRVRAITLALISVCLAFYNP